MGIRFSGHNRYWFNKALHTFFIVMRALIIVYILFRAVPDLFGTLWSTIWKEELAMAKYQDKKEGNYHPCWINWLFYTFGSLFLWIPVITSPLWGFWMLIVAACKK